MLVFLLFATARSIFFHLPSFTEVCIGYQTSVTSELWGIYVISGEGDKNVQVTIYNFRNVMVYISEPNTREGKFSIQNAGAGTYRLCFKCLDSAYKSVSFEIKSDHKEEETLLPEKIEPLEDNLRTLNKKVEEVYRNLVIFQRRETVHRDLTENNCNQILWAALIKIAGLAVITCSQVWGLTRILNKSSSNKI